MNKLLSANLQVWHLLVGLGAVVALGAGGVVMARPAPPQPVVGSSGDVTPAAFFASGAFHMTAAASNQPVYIKEPAGKTDVLSVAFTVPAGQRADIIGFFNSKAYKFQNGYCYLEFHIDSLTSTALNPGELWVADGYVYKGGYPTLSAQGFKSNIPAGAHRLYVSMRATGGDCYLSGRSLVVLANTHT